jgi:nitrogen fixation-related uncharacterized protein
MCPSCLSGGIGPGYLAAFAVCILFFIISVGVMLWASKSGKLDDLEDAKFKMLEDAD